MVSFVPDLKGFQVEKSDHIYEVEDHYEFRHEVMKGAHEVNLHEFYEKMSEIEVQVKPAVKCHITSTFDHLIGKRYSGKLGWAKRTSDSLRNYFHGEGLHSDEFLAAKLLNRIEVKEEASPMAAVRGGFQKVKGMWKKANLGRKQQMIMDQVFKFRGNMGMRLALIGFVNLFLEQVDSESIKSKGVFSAKEFTLRPKNKEFNYEGAIIALDDEVKIKLDPKAQRVNFEGVNFGLIDKTFLPAAAALLGIKGQNPQLKYMRYDENEFYMAMDFGFGEKIEEISILTNEELIKSLESEV